MGDGESSSGWYPRMGDGESSSGWYPRMGDGESSSGRYPGMSPAWRGAPPGVQPPPAVPGWEPAPGLGSPPGRGEGGSTWPTAPPPPRRRAEWWAALLAVALMAAIAGIALGILHGVTRSSSAAMAAQVDPAVVNIDSSLAGGTGLAAGTGMVIGASGMVLTNNHVIAGSASITVQVAGGTRHPARVIGDDPSQDVAVVQVSGVSGLPTVSFGSSSTVRPGERVYLVGNALGRGGPPAISPGTVTAVGQTITATDPTGAPETLSAMIRVSGLIQSGDSGGPLVDSSGQVVGMDTAGAMNPSPGAPGAGAETSRTAFAIPIDRARAIAAQIEAGRPGNGVEIGPGPLIGVEVRDASTVPFSPVPAGAYVEGVQPGTPAAAAGLAPGDVIVALGPRPVRSTSDLSGALRAYRPGQRVTLAWVDPQGTRSSTTITLASGPPA
jgi:S1-C subfamily serine protease